MHLLEGCDALRSAHMLPEALKRQRNTEKLTFVKLFLINISKLFLINIFK